MDPQHHSPSIAVRVLKWVGRATASLFVFVLVVLIFFSWQTHRRETQTILEAAPSSGRFIEADHTKIFIQEAGARSGQPVLLIHGTGAWSEIWRETISPLVRAGFHVIAMDVPPFGYSEKPHGAAAYGRENQAKRILGVLDALDLRNAVVVGHSVGARPTIEAALENPARIEKLVLVDPALGFQPDSNATAHFEQNRPSWFARTFWSLQPLRNAALSTYGTNPLSTKRLFRSFVSRKEAVTDARVQMLQQPLSITNTTNAQGEWLEMLLVSQDTSLASEFSSFQKLHMPVLVIWGASDTVTPLWQGKQLHALIPNSQLSVIEGVGHIPYIENAEAFNNALLKFLGPGN